MTDKTPMEQEWVRIGQEVYECDSGKLIFKLVHAPKETIDRIVSDHNWRHEREALWDDMAMALVDCRRHPRPPSMSDAKLDNLLARIEKLEKEEADHG